MTQTLTISADEAVIRKAREKAHREHRSLEYLLQNWLESYVGTQADPADHARIMDRLRHVSAGRHFSRDELNDR